MSEEIIEFVRKRQGCSWTDLESEFVKRRGWSKGKFVNHWKEAKPCLEKALNKKGQPRYFFPHRAKKAEDRRHWSPRPKESLWKLLLAAVTIVIGSLFALPIFLDIARMPSPAFNTTVWNSTAWALEWIRPRLIVVPFIMLFVGILLLLASVLRIRKSSLRRIMSILRTHEG